MPIRLRLTLWYLATLLILFALFAVYFVSQAYFTLLAHTDNTLALAAGQAIHEVELLPEPGFSDELALRRAMHDIDNDLTVMIVSQDGTLYQQISDGTFPLPEFIVRDDDGNHDDDLDRGLGAFVREGLNIEVSEHVISRTGPIVLESNNPLGGELFNGEVITEAMMLAEILPTVVPLDDFETVEMDGIHWRFHSQRVDGAESGEVWIQVAQSLELLDAFWRDVTIQMLWTVPLVLLLAGLIGYWMAQRALAPIAEMTATAQEISAQALDRRIDYSGAPDEVGRLAQTMDSMFDRLQSAFQRERRFTDDAAHELRTPLTALKGKIEVTLSRDRQPEDYVNAVSSMGDQVDRLIRLSNDLLFMARFDQARKPEIVLSSLNVAELFHAVIEQIYPLAEQKSLHIVQEISPNLTLSGDTDLLVRLFLNILDNAIKYTPDGGTISIRAQPSSAGVHIEIQDTGIGIPESDLPHLFTRFYRVAQDRARSDDLSHGSGLGLAIAQEIVHIHDGTITAASNPSQGTTITVCI